jgi:SAM-dependent methyltransferase
MPQINGDSELQTTVLEDLSDAVNYRHWLADLVRPYLGDDPLEIGSGLGAYVAEWLPQVPRFTATEADDQRLLALKKQFVDEPRVAVRELHMPTDERGEHSCVVALNVLEHIEDDVTALRSAARLLRPGGAFVLVVPAFPAALSEFDRLIGHVRRYTTATLGTALTEAGLRVEKLQYINPTGLIGWYLLCRLLRRRPANGPALRAYDRFVIPTLRRAEHGRRPPFGQSVFTVARVS